MSILMYGKRERERKNKQKVAASTPPSGLKRGGEGSGALCAYLGCDREAESFCLRCKYPFCKKHLNNHFCVGELLAIARRLREDFESFGNSDVVIEDVQRELQLTVKEPITLYTTLYAAYKWYVDFLSTLKRIDRDFDTREFINYVYARLFYKLYEWLYELRIRGFGAIHRVLIIDRDVYEFLVNPPPPYDLCEAGLAFSMVDIS